MEKNLKKQGLPLGRIPKNGISDEFAEYINPASEYFKPKLKELIDKYTYKEEREIKMNEDLKKIDELKRVQKFNENHLHNTTQDNFMNSMWDSNLKDFQKEKFDYFLRNEAIHRFIDELCYKSLEPFESEEAELQAKIIAATEYPSKLVTDIRNQWKASNNGHYNEKLKWNVCKYFLNEHICYLKQREQNILAFYDYIKSDECLYKIEFAKVKNSGPYESCLVYVPIKKCYRTYIVNYSDIGEQIYLA
ncbi:MAG: hypothetical protein WCG23_00170 [bacterium]